VLHRWRAGGEGATGHEVLASGSYRYYLVRLRFLILDPGNPLGAYLAISIPLSGLPPNNSPITIPVNARTASKLSLNRRYVIPKAVNHGASVSRFRTVKGDRRPRSNCTGVTPVWTLRRCELQLKSARRGLVLRMYEVQTIYPL
jgi:hypothetical protein